MEGSAPAANTGGARDGQGGSPLASLSALVDRLRTVAEERLGPDGAKRLRDAKERVKALGGDRLSPGGGERLRTVAEGLRDPAGATAGLEPFEERPELYVGAAFAGGLALAGLVRLLGR